LAHRPGGCPDAAAAGGGGGSSTTSISTTGSAATEAAGTVDAAIGSSTLECEGLGFHAGRESCTITTTNDQESRTRQRHHRTDGQATACRHHHHCRRLRGTAGRMRNDDDRLTRMVLSDEIVFIEQTTARAVDLNSIVCESGKIGFFLLYCFPFFYFSFTRTAFLLLLLFLF